MLFYTSFVLFFIACNGNNAVDKAIRNPICKQRNSYYLIEGSCDSYIECKDYVAHEMLCPDGLNYNAEARWPNYPCGYPMDVPCLGRTYSQPANPTADCQHQYGFYKSPRSSEENCGPYRMCVEGKPIEMECPAGLAFNPDTARCDWPHLVPSCNAAAFLGFECPENPLDENGQMLDIVTNYKFEDNCFAFYSCERGNARLLSCDAGYAFDPTIGHCVDAELVVCEGNAVQQPENSSY